MDENTNQELELSDIPKDVQLKVLDWARQAQENQDEWLEFLNDEVKKCPNHSIQSLLALSRSQEGETVLHEACKSRNLELLQFLLQKGAMPWNIVNDSGVAAGELALDWSEGLTFWIEEAVRYELVMSALGQRGNRDEDGMNPDNSAYLCQPLRFMKPGKDDVADTVLVDQDDQGVMMGWELPLMKAHVERFMKDRIPEETVVLNVGFGLGLIDTEFQKYPLKHHHIIEAHPDVLKKMEEDGWLRKENVTLHGGRWQDVLPELQGEFDIVYFDTFSEDYWDMQEFHEELPNLMNPGGVYSWFNGLGGTNPFFHKVFCELAKVELTDLGFEVSYEAIPVDSEGVWNGIKRRYWDLDYYNLPTAVFTGL